MPSRLARLLTAITFSVCLPPPHAYCSPEAAETHYAAGRTHLSAGNHFEARKAFARAVAEDPGHVDAHYRLGLLYAEDIMSWDNAEMEFLGLPALASTLRGKSRDELLFKSGLALGRLYVRSGRTGEAIRILRSIIASAPAGAPVDEAHGTLGVAYYYERLYDDAMFELRVAIKLKPSNMEARFNLKTIRSRLEHYQAAKAYSRLGDRAGAIAEFRRAIELDPRFIEARHRLGFEFHLLGQHADALKEFRRAESVSPLYRKKYEIWYAEGLALKALGRPDDALRKFQATVEAKPRFADAHSMIGQLWMQKEDYESAIRSFVLAIGIDPKTEYVRHLQSCMLKQRDKLSAARPEGAAVKP